MNNIKSRFCYRRRKYTICKRVYVCVCTFNFLQFGAVKGLIASERDLNDYYSLTD